jgi:hypothetical protein
MPYLDKDLLDLRKTNKILGLRSGFRNRFLNEDITTCFEKKSSDLVMVSRGNHNAYCVYLLGEFLDRWENTCSNLSGNDLGGSWMMIDKSDEFAVRELRIDPRMFSSKMPYANHTHSNRFHD